jgi:hypothetical protein
VTYASPLRHRLAKECNLPKEAMQGIVEMLEELSQILQGLALIREVSPRLRARVCAFGERMSTSLAVEILKVAGVKASLLQSKDFLVTDAAHQDEDKYLNATVIPKRDPEFADETMEKTCGFQPEVVIMQGFVARSHKGETCLLGAPPCPCFPKPCPSKQHHPWSLHPTPPLLPPYLPQRQKPDNFGREPQSFPGPCFEERGGGDTVIECHLQVTHMTTPPFGLDRQD